MSPPAPSPTASLNVATPTGLLPTGFVARTRCPLCDADIARCPILVPFADIPVHRCEQCGFIFPTVVMSAEGARRYYREVFASPWHRQGQELNSYINEAALRKIPGFDRVRSFLDVGTGYGFLLHRLKVQMSIDAVGSEPSVQEAGWGTANLGVRIVNTLLAESGLPEASFDAVASFEVIEHTQDPRAFVAELARYVKPGGLLILNTDNFESTAVKRLGPRFAKWIPHSHVSDFAPATLTRCVESVPGLRVESQLSYTAWENWLRGVLALAKSTPDPRACFDLSAELSREMNRTYRFWPLRLAIARAWFALTWRRDLAGSMMYVVARKS